MNFTQILNVLDSVGQSIPGLFTVIQVVLILLAVVLACKGLIELSGSRRQYQRPRKNAVMSIIAGSLLISVNQLLAVGTFTFFRVSQNYPILTQYETQGSDDISRIFYAISAYLYFVGWIWMAYAVFKVHSGPRAQPPDSSWKSKAIIAAAMSIFLVNFDIATEILLNTVGQPSTVQSYFQFTPS